MKLKYNNIVPLIANALKRFAKFFYRLYVKMPVREMKWWKKLLLWSGRGVLYLLTLALVVDINLFGLFGSSPHLSDLRSPEMNMASELYAADGTLIGRYFLENRSLVDFSELPPDLVNALLSAEDIRFYSHYGIDLRATVAAFWSTARGETRKTGGEGEGGRKYHYATTGQEPL
jgi:penicillin-binding protein 1A